MSGSANGYQFFLTYSISPIILMGGIAANQSNGTMPIITLTQGVDPDTGALPGGGSTDPSDYFATFMPLPGSTLAENEMGMYPFANNSVAANAIIAQPLSISMLMICTARLGAGGYAGVQSTMTALVQSLAQHDAMGGTYTVLTPKYPYFNCIRTRMPDASSGETKQAQNTYQLDFRQPLLTLEAAQNAQNSLMSKLSNGSQLQGQPMWSGSQSTLGQSDLPALS
jgi:hypothetical protein